MQDLNDMVFFAEVAERGGFAAAARTLGIPKSRLSRRIAGLEHRLGVQLMQRSTRRLSLTAAGEQYLRHCTALREAAEAADEVVALAQPEPRGTVRLSCPVTLAQTSLAPLLPVFLARYPRVRIEMRVINRSMDPVEEGVDIALRVRPRIEDSATLVARSFGIGIGRLVIAPGLLRRQGPVHAPADLDRLDGIAMSAADGRAQWPLQGPGDSTHVHFFAPRYVADDLLTLKFAAVDGVGAVLLPSYLCREELGDGRLVEVLPGWTSMPVVVHAVFPARRALLPAVRHLIDFLAEHLGPEGLVEANGPIDGRGHELMRNPPYSNK